MKILIVDDEIVSRKSMQLHLKGFAECHTVESGTEAITIFEKAIADESPFDIVTLDVSMPDMSGIDVLKTFKKIEEEKGILPEKRAKIIMITSHAYKDKVIECYNLGCDAYVSKPSNKKILINKLQSLGFDISTSITDDKKVTIRDMVMETVTKFKQGKIQLPILPQAIQDIQNIMEQGSASIDEIAGIVEKDPVISVKLIAVSNSPQYKGVEKVKNVTTAINRIGLKECQDIIIAIANKSLYETKHKLFKELMERLWQHSLACAKCAKILSTQLGIGNKDKIFLMGLVHDIGKVLLLKSLGILIKSIKTIDKKELIESIQEFHTTLGASLLYKWEFSQEFIEIAELHEWMMYDPNANKELLIINLSNAIVRQIGFSFFDDDKINLEDYESPNILNVDNELIATIGEEVKAEMDKLAV